MNPDIVRLAHGEIGGPIIVGRVRSVVASRYGAEENWVWLSKQTLQKQLLHHPEITLDYYEDLEWLFRHGEVVEDYQPGRFHVFAGQGVQSIQTRMKACLKVVSGNRRIMMVSLHAVRARDYRRLLRRSKK